VCQLPQPCPRCPTSPDSPPSPVWRKGSLVAPNAALKLVLYLLNKYSCSCLSRSLGLWG
uniref:Uncharacterized protein n=1 Tax=Peromyscus maniculatus bairdii TaxID=230844 RepID=A0A8C8W675_PERMB